jgi:uncharacterized protein (TIGR04255 family)
VPTETPASPTRADSPAFGAPPVSEVAIGIQFPAQVADDGIALADFWPKVRPAFPTLEKALPLPPMVENFDFPPPATPPVQFFSPQGLPQRYWFISSDETRLLQLQSDRFILNWRHRRPQDVYPHYEVLSSDFEQRFATFREESLPPERRSLALPNWCEVTYINVIDAVDRDLRRHRPLRDILRLVASPRSSQLLPPEDTQVQQRSIIFSLDDASQPIGRLYILAAPGLRPEDNRPIYQLTLTVRIQPAASTMESMFAALNRAHDLIIHTFVAITTPRMHKVWKLEGEPE